jgi:uridine kinase
MLIIGIAGGTGSGKTTVVNQILNELPGNRSWNHFTRFLLQTK